MAGVVSGANAGAGADPRDDLRNISSHTGNMFDNASFEEYLYYAKISRADERYETDNWDYKFFGKTIKKSTRPAPSAQLQDFKNRGPNDAILSNHSDEKRDVSPDSEKKDVVANAGPQPYVISDEEYTNASRALRTATWGGVFYLITTDILGPFSTPWSFAAMGYGPGIAIYSVLGFFAFYGGLCLWRCFLDLDSTRFPLTTYGDIAYRVYGEWARQICNFLQFVQLWFNVAIICVVNGQNLEQILVNGNKTPLCYVICILVWALAGMVGGQIRTLNKLSWIANISIWLNLFIIFGTMVLVARDGPNYTDAVALNGATFPGIAVNQPVMTTGGAPYGFQVTLLGLTIAVFSWGGATVFVEFMAEMRRPFDFWKGMFCAQLFIYLFYMLFGLFVYSYQGQFSINPSFQGIAEYNWQAAMDGIQIVTGTIGGLLYANIGIKVLYNQVLLRHFRFPHLSSRGGKFAWALIVPVYWGLSFILGAAIPQISSLQGFVGAVCIFQFSYTFPPALMSGLLVKREAMLDGDGFDPRSGQVVRQDRGIKRWIRGFTKTKKYFALNTFNVILVLASLATAALGAYSAILGIEANYAATGGATSFTCANPFSG